MGDIADLIDVWQLREGEILGQGWNFDEGGKRFGRKATSIQAGEDY